MTAPGGDSADSAARVGGVDRALLAIALILVALGVVMVFSASALVAAERFGKATFFAERHLVRAVIGIALMLALARLPADVFARFARPAMLLVLGLLLLLLLGAWIGWPPTINGVRRWITLGPLTFQPSELAKVALVLYLAEALPRKGRRVRKFWMGLAGPLIVVLFVAALVAAEPDLSGASTIVPIALVVFWLGGVRLSHVVLLGGTAVVCFLAIVLGVGHGIDRIIGGFLDRSAHAHQAGYHLSQSLLGLGSGGLWGLGLGASRQKMFFLPEPHTDFIFSVIGEELGFIGALLTCGLFIAYVFRAWAIARRAPTQQGFLLAAGLAGTLGLSAWLHVAVVLGVVPPTGLPLPFVSYGGTALVMALASTGVILSISRTLEPQRRWLKPVGTVP